MQNKPLKIVYCTPALYMAGGVERVLTLKANYFAEQFGYDITIILTEGMDKPLFYPLSDKIKIVHLDINFEEMWTCSFFKKIWIYLKKQRAYKKQLTAELMRLRPDITISLLRREINFLCDIPDGSKKIGELHINRANYRNFDESETNIIKKVFSRLWMKSLVAKLAKLESLIVLTEKDREAWTELNNVEVIPNPLPFIPKESSNQFEKRVVVVGRYSFEKGFDYLLKVWSIVEHQDKDWRMDVFGDGDSSPYEKMMEDLKIDRSRCTLHGRTSNVQLEYINSSIAVCSSRFEGFGLTIIEAMACGLPVVSFDCPWGPRSIIANQQDGIIVENGNVKQMADAIIELINNEDKRRALAGAALVNVQRFQLEAVAKRWKVLFDRYS